MVPECDPLRWMPAPESWALRAIEKAAGVGGREEFFRRWCRVRIRSVLNA